MLSARVCLLTPHLLLVLVQLSPAGGHRTTGPRVSASAGKAPTCAGREVFWPLIYRRGKGGDRPCPRLYCLVPCGPLEKVAEIKFHCPSPPPPFSCSTDSHDLSPVGFLSRTSPESFPSRSRPNTRRLLGRWELGLGWSRVSLHWSPCWRSWQAEGVCVCVCVCGGGEDNGGGEATLPREF